MIEVLEDNKNVSVGLETIQDHRNYFKNQCTQGLQQANTSIDNFPVSGPIAFATIILDSIARHPYEVTIDIDDLTLLQSMKLVALAEICLLDLPSMLRVQVRSQNMRRKYRTRIEKSGWKEKVVLRVLGEEDLLS